MDFQQAPCKSLLENFLCVLFVRKNAHVFRRANMNKYDVAIVGGGPAGIFAAYELCLKKPGLKIILLESGKDIYNEYKMSPTSISGGGKLLTGGELISPASCDAKLVPVGKH